MSAADSNRCTAWCSDECDYETEGVHTSCRTIASTGGPMTEVDTDRLVDIAPSVGLRRFHDGAADVQLVINVWTRMGRDNWGVYGELIGLFRPVPMTATRARELAKLLTEAADEADRLNDATGTNVVFPDFGSGA